MLSRGNITAGSGLNNYWAQDGRQGSIPPAARIAGTVSAPAYRRLTRLCRRCQCLSCPLCRCRFSALLPLLCSSRVGVRVGLEV